jgi:Spy/CpxP family protein refolding chaperone
MRHKNLLSVAAFAALLSVPALAAAAPARGPAQVLANPRLLARYLRLTEAQIEQQKELVQAHRAVVEPLAAQHRELRADLREALEGSSPEACSVGELVLDLHAVGDQIRAARAELDEAFSAILTPEQLARYEALKEAVRLLRDAGDRGGGRTGR